MTKHDLSQSLHLFSERINKLAERLRDLSTTVQAHVLGIISDDLPLAISAGWAVLEEIKAYKPDVWHWKAEKKLHSLETTVVGLVGQLNRLGDALNDLNRVPGDRSAMRSLLELGSDRFANAAVYLEKLGDQYGRDVHHLQSASKSGRELVAFNEVSKLGRMQTRDPALLYLGTEVPADLEVSIPKSVAVGPSEATQLATLVPVHFATDRYVAEGTQSPQIRFKNGRGAGMLTYGVAEVSIPPGHVIGRLERPTIWKFQFKEDAKKHVMVTSCETKSIAEWKASASDRLSTTGNNAALVFIHGYNTSLEDAIRRAAQIGLDLQFSGLVTAYSWSSEARVDGYFADEEAVQLTVPLLEEFLLILRRELNVQTIHVVAHSMGNRALVEMLSAISVVAPEPPLLKEVVMAAPDIDSDRFKAAVAGLSGKAHRYTLYGSENDAALKISKKLRKGYPRAGDGGINILVVAGIETVDASAVGEDLLGLGHAYFAKKRTLLSDLSYLIRQSMPAASRYGLKSALKGPLTYWLFQP